MLLNCSRPLSFQLTTSRRGRPPCPSSSQSPFSFQLTTSRRGRRWEALLPRWWNLHFNSRPHEEVDVCPLKFLVGHSAISTHDLTKRSTFNGCVPFAYVFISTHDLTKRSTCAPRTAASFSAFQLTTSRRGRQQNCIFYSSLLHLLLAHCTNNLYPIIIIYIILTF